MSRADRFALVIGLALLLPLIVCGLSLVPYAVWLRVLHAIGYAYARSF